MHDSAEAQTLVCVRLRREEVLKKWPSVSEETRQLSTAAKESACRRWLTNTMRENPEAPRPKKQVRAEAQEQFPGLGRNAFDRAWANVIVNSGAEAWGKAGRRS